VKQILAENYVRPDEAERVKSTIRERGSLKVIDKVTVTLNEKRDVYEALLANLGVKGIEVSNSYVKKFEKLLIGGIWCIVTLEYFYEEDQRGSPVRDARAISSTGGPRYAKCLRSCARWSRKGMPWPSGRASGLRP
jgi:ATP-dependent Lon protease